MASSGFAPSRLLLPLLFLVLGSFVYNLRETVDLNAYMTSVRDTYDASFGAPPIELEHSSATKKTELLVNAKMELDEMEKVHRPDHGSFFFGSRSDEITIPDEFVFEPSDDWLVTNCVLCVILFLLMILFVCLWNCVSRDILMRCLIH